MDIFPTAHGIKLYNIQINIEKSIEPILDRLKKYTEYDLCESTCELEKSRQIEWNLLHTKVKNILKPLNAKMILIKNNELGNINDFKQFKKEMILIQDNIQNLKFENKKQIEHLNREEKDLIDDVQFYSEKLLEWDEPIQINLCNTTSFQKPKGLKSKHQCKEVKEFMDFIHASGGHENGWSQEDHHLFIKFRKKYKNIDAIAKKLNEELPDISIEDVKLHDEWYRKYIKLEMKKRNALKSWQKERANRQKVSMKYSNIPAKVTTNLQISVNIQEQLKKWKAQKEEQKRTAKQIEKYNKQKSTEIEQLRQTRNEELKMLVQDWKQKRENVKEHEIKEKIIEAEKEKKRRAVEANRLIKQFRSQDDIYISKMKQKRKPEPCTIKRSKSSNSAKRDPGRLLKPTLQWINRVHDENSVDQFGKVMPLRCLPKLGIPEWRRMLE